MGAVLLPLWKEALRRFTEMNPQPGTILTREWLMDQFDLRKPQTAEEYERTSLEFLRLFTCFREALLEEHMIDLKAVHGKGWEVIAPKDQTRVALETRTRNIAVEIRKMARSIECVNTSQLSEAERTEHTNGLAKTAAIKSMFNRRKLLGRS